ncbi:leucine-rich repeat and calponin homology domain-containing protein 1-like [Limulus polyphemus]|uniref:Leucine-rich repeat and calponin homology domain-containing protein 1-like n=1 Tax=Limulus polyphemus TaxID=6850 RepID=A0ABM1S547_LIMPO|nr:leucine-rich repeat and calponin homology domain-containing protein 1-like [Limulus polyphemus]
MEKNLQTSSSVILENNLQSDFLKTTPCFQKYSVKVDKGFKEGCDKCRQGLSESCLCQRIDGETQSHKKIVHSNYMIKVDYKHSWTRSHSEDSKNDTKANGKKEFENHHSKPRLNGPHVLLDFKKQSSLFTEPVIPSLSIKRRLNSAKEEQELIDQLRRLIENILKVTLPDDLGGALRDGILLCQLMNQLYPHSLVSIHVPSALVPRLPVTKRRLNVENFLKSCEKTGVPKADLFKWEEVVMQEQVAKVAHTVQVLLSLSKVTLQTDLYGGSDVFLSYLLVGLFVGTCLMILLCPPPP